jgi:hypothetical protein
MMVSREFQIIIHSIPTQPSSSNQQHVDTANPSNTAAIPFPTLFSPRVPQIILSFYFGSDGRMQEFGRR